VCSTVRTPILSTTESSVREKSVLIPRSPPSHLIPGVGFASRPCSDFPVLASFFVISFSSSPRDTRSFSLFALAHSRSLALILAKVESSSIDGCTKSYALYIKTAQSYLKRSGRRGKNEPEEAAEPDTQLDSTQVDATQPSSWKPNHLSAVLFGVILLLLCYIWLTSGAPAPVECMPPTMVAAPETDCGVATELFPPHE
jgi:hypothetical protein